MLPQPPWQSVERAHGFQKCKPWYVGSELGREREGGQGHETGLCRLGEETGVGVGDSPGGGLRESPGLGKHHPQGSRHPSPPTIPLTEAACSGWTILLGYKMWACRPTARRQTERQKLKSMQRWVPLAKVGMREGETWWTEEGVRERERERQKEV